MERNKPREKKYTPSKEELKSAVIGKMKEMNLWDVQLANEIAPCWDSFENFIIFSSKYFINENWNKAGCNLWEHVSKLFGGKSIALQGKIKNDDFRSPNARVVFGPSHWVTLSDNGIRYTWNVEFTMFCSGNVSERHRIARFNCEGETIVDMFAGIGYFTLPYLVHARAKQVYACEWNPKSLEALRLNLEKNKVANMCIILEGDVSLKAPRGVADRINLGLIPSCEQYWQTAATILKPSGGVLHVHGNVTSYPTVHIPISQCGLCISLLETMTVSVTDKSDINNLNGFVISTENEDMVRIKLLNEDEKLCVKWKKAEWFVWSVHVCHSFCNYLTALTKTYWTVEPLFLHRVKAYAPHIDHFVLDICCKNTMAPLLRQESNYSST